MTPWTTTPPTVSGWYWTLWIGGTPNETAVVYVSNDFYVWDAGIESSLPVDEYGENYLWSGPIQPPPREEQT